MGDSVNLELQRLVKNWMEDDPDPGTRSEMEELLAAGSYAQLADRFRNRLEFGTAGLRGLMGAGPNRMNRALVRKVTAGLGAYLLEQVDNAAERGVVVGYDARRLSKEFAEDTCAVLAGAGIRVHTYDTTVSTPRVAFTCGTLNAAAGVVITASHNPPAYNGYKVYWENAAQIIPPHDIGISEAIDRVGPVLSIPMIGETQARSLGLWQDAPPEAQEEYLRRVVELCVTPEGARDFGIVYTPLHGVGARDMGAVMAKAGFLAFEIVAGQEEPDGEFPTVEFPNPEEPGAMDLALEQARNVDAVLVLANDPDADRLAVALKSPSGSYRMLSGNDIGAMMGHYLLTQSSFSKQPLVCTTIVSSSILSKIAGDCGAQYVELLTGFKWIANKAMELEATGVYEFVFGFEEALGFTVRDLVRDKDGVGAGIVFADLVGWCLARGVHPLEYLDSIYETYGYHASAQVSMTLPGQDGLEQIQAIMTSFRENPPTDISGSRISEITDFSTSISRTVESGEESPVDVPKSNVLRFFTENGTRLLVRPSGTEPKIKFYIEAVTHVRETGKTQEAVQNQVQTILEAFVAGIQSA